MTDIIGEIEAAIVPVHIKSDTRRKKNRYLRTTLKSYSIDNVTQPVVLVAGFNPNRYKCQIATNDTAIIVTQDNPSNASQVSTTTTPVAGAGLHTGTMGNGFQGHTIYGPNPIWAVSITGNAVTRVNVLQHNWAYDD